MEAQPYVHPLLIEHVIEKILESMNPTFLAHYCKTFRLVSKLWSRAATHVYRKHFGQMTLTRNVPGRRTEEFIRTMRTSADIPFDKFEFNTDSYHNEHFGDILQECSGAIVNLEVFISNPCNLRFPKYYPDLVLGRLQSLTIHVRLDGTEIHLGMYSILVSLLKGAPLLKRLDLKVFGGSPIKEPLVNKFGNALVDNLPPTVKEIKLNITLTDGQLIKLGQKQKDLISLDVYFQQSVFQPGTVQYFLQCLAPTLRFCKVVGKQFLVDIKYPVFCRVEHLVVWGQPSALFRYKDVFPRLIKLEVCMWDIIEYGKMSVFPKNCTSSTVMEIDFPAHISRSAVILSLGNCFQNLRILRKVTVQSFEVMTTIFTNLLRLTELDLFLEMEFQGNAEGGLGVDTVFTGIPADMCDWLLYHRDFSRETLFNQYRDWPSLRKLTNLKSLRLTAANVTEPSLIMMTDVTAHYAFLRMENLERLHLDYFPLSKPCINLLQSKFHLTRTHRPKLSFRWDGNGNDFFES